MEKEENISIDLFMVSTKAEKHLMRYEHTAGKHERHWTTKKRGL